MERTYQISHRGTLRCDDSITIRQFLHKILAASNDPGLVNMDILTIYDEPRRRVINAPFASLAGEYLSFQRLHVCYHVPGAFLMTEGQHNNGITYSTAYEAIPDPMYLPLEIDGKYRYPTISGHCKLGNFVNFMQKRGFIPENVTTMTVHECFCWNSIPAQTFDLSPDSPVRKKKLNQLNLYSGPPIYCTFQ